MFLVSISIALLPDISQTFNHCRRFCYTHSLRVTYRLTFAILGDKRETRIDEYCGKLEISNSFPRTYLVLSPCLDLKLYIRRGGDYLDGATNEGKEEYFLRNMISGNFKNEAIRRQ